MKHIDFRSIGDKALTAFAFALGVAAAKWVCTLVTIRGFNLNF